MARNTNAGDFAPMHNIKDFNILMKIIYLFNTFLGVLSHIAFI